MPITWLDEIDDAKLAQKRVLLRVDVNVPIDEHGEIIDAKRIETVLPTIRRLMRAGAKIVLLSHLGQPKGKPKPSLSLEPVAAYLRDLLDQELTFVHDCVGEGIGRIINESAPGSVVFLENLRFHSGEEKNDLVFAKLLAKNMDIYVNDAFSCSHRAHASVDNVTKFFTTTLGGLALKKELTALQRIFTHPKRPLVAIVGGAKISSKIGVLLQLLKKVDALLIGGAMAYTFLRAQGIYVGKSLIEEDKLSLAQSLLRKASELGVAVHVPQDHVVVDDLTHPQEQKTITNDGFMQHLMGVDIGPQTIVDYKTVIGTAETIFVNGPMGIYERDEYFRGTDAILRAVADAPGYSVVGGGDSVAALNKAHLLDEVDYVSSGGGALLELVEGKKLPGLSALGYYD